MGEAIADPRIVQVMADLHSNIGELVLSMTALSQPTTVGGFLGNLNHCERRSHEIGDQFALLRTLLLDQPLSR